MIADFFYHIKSLSVTDAFTSYLDHDKLPKITIVEVRKKTVYNSVDNVQALSDCPITSVRRI